MKFGDASRPGPRPLITPKYATNSGKETTMTPSRDWIDINWADGSLADVSRRIAVLPLAATEQHGPHLPLETDVLIADAYLARVRELLPANVPATFLPVEPVGISTEHIDFPGTQTLPTEVALKRWTAIGEDVARRGLKKLVIITSHGGNSAAMMLVAQDLRAHRKLFVVTTSWSRLSGAEKLFPADEVRHGIHGGAVETSIMLARYPDQVRKDAIADFPASSIAMERAVSLAVDAAARTVRLAGAGSPHERRDRQCDAGCPREGCAARRSGCARLLRAAGRGR
ncbi:creatinine amidohydrolase [Bradyrhizobium sp. i1.3.1]